MKYMIQTLIVLFSLSFLTGCNEEKRESETQEHKSMWEGLDEPVDRSKSKSY